MVMVSDRRGGGPAAARWARGRGSWAQIHRMLPGQQCPQSLLAFSAVNSISWGEGPQAPGFTRDREKGRWVPALPSGTARWLLAALRLPDLEALVFGASAPRTPDLRCSPPRVQSAPRRVPDSGSNWEQPLFTDLLEDEA